MRDHSEMVSTLAVLGVIHVDHSCFEAWVTEQKPNTPAIGPPTLAKGIKLFFQTAGRPSLEVSTDFLGSGIEGSDNDVNVIGAAVDGVQMPTPMSTSLCDLLFDCGTFCMTESAGVLGH